MYVYYGTYHYKAHDQHPAYAELKIGMTSNIKNRMNTLYYQDCIRVKDYRELPEEFDFTTYALFVESYLRMKLFEYATEHPALNIQHIKTDYFSYNYRYWGLMESNGIQLFNKWVDEAINFLTERS